MKTVYNQTKMPFLLRPWLLFTVAAFLAVLPRVLFIDMPLERDEGAYAYMADALGRGETPYVDVFDHKPPLIYYIYAAAFKIFGHSAEAVRLMALIAVGFACLQIAAMVYKYTVSLWAALLAGIFLGWATLNPTLASVGANTEVFTLPFIIFGTRLLVEGGGWWRYFCAGLAFGVGILIKQPVAFIGLGIYLAVVWQWVNKPQRMVMLSAGCALGVTIPFLALVLYYYSIGQMACFWDCFYSYNKEYIAFFPMERSWARFQMVNRQIFLNDPLFWGLGIAGVVYVINDKRKLWLDRLVLTFWSIGSVVALGIGRFYHGHYYIVLLPVVAYGLGVLIHRIRISPAFGVRALVLLIVALTLNYGPLWNKTPQEMCIASYEGSTGVVFARAQVVGEYLAMKARGESAFIVGSEPEILFYAGLKSASRMIYNLPLISPTRKILEYNGQTIVELKKHPPQWLIIHYGADTAWPLGAAVLAGNQNIDYQLISVNMPNMSGMSEDVNSIMRCRVELLLGSFLVFRSVGKQEVVGPTLKDLCPRLYD